MNETAEKVLTTSQAALLLRVHESSVKRWSNLGELELEKTAGGHRRIQFDTLIDFARKKEIASELLAFSPHEEEVAWAGFSAREKNDFEPLCEIILRFCDTESPRWLSRLFRYLEDAFGLPTARIFDMGVAGALREVGRQWETGSRTIALEHRFTQKILDALHGILTGLEESRAYGSIPGRHAVIGCAEGCHHEIGGLMTRILLEQDGWTVTYLGANVPFEELAGIQELERAQLMCVPFVAPLGISDVRRCLKVIGALYQPAAPYRLVIGGVQGTVGTEEMYGTPMPLKFVDSMEAFSRWARAAFPEPVMEAA